MANMSADDLSQLSIDDLKNYAKNYSKNTQATGSYGEGGAVNYSNILKELKNRVANGDLKITDYQDLAKPITKSVIGSINSLVQQGQGSLATNLSEGLRSEGFLKANPDNSNAFNLPFDQQELAKLPVNVLPTQSDIDKGIISRDALPFMRLQDPTGGGVDAQGNPIPADINLGSDRGQIELEAQRQADELQKTLDQQKTLRDQNRTALASQLAQYQTDQFNRAIPDLAEQANTSGIYRSTGFGDILARKYSELTKDTENQLAMQGLSDSEKYVSGLGDIANTRTGLQTGGLQREFSLNDAASSAALAKQLAQLSQPSSSSSKTTADKWDTGIQAGSQIIGSLLKPK